MTIRQFRRSQKPNLSKPAISTDIGGEIVTMDTLEQQVAELRSRPLLILCRTPKGKEQVMTLEECRQTGSRYIHLAADALDRLLAAELGE